MKQFKNLQVDVREQIAVLTFNRPDVLNALNTEVVTEAREAVGELSSMDDVRVLVITGSGRAFVAGADIAEMRDKTPDQARSYSQLGHSLMQSIQDMEKPVIAAVNGYCLGGGAEVALACDIRLASEKARFGLPETILGIIPGWGATQRAARLMGPALAKELIFTGEHISAQRALEIGLVNRVVPHDRLMDTTMEMARTIKKQGQIALSYAKKVINQGIEKSLKEGCEMEIDTFVSCFHTDDCKEGMEAFLEKRQPQFKGK